jgi:hypothetical protein
MESRVEAWLAAAIGDARKRGLPELAPLLEGLARSLSALRDADADARSRPETHGAAPAEQDEP